MEAAVVGMPHPDDNEHPVAFVTKVPDAKVYYCNYNKITDRDFIK